MGKRVVVTGGRGYSDRATVDRALSAVQKKYGVDCLIHGGAKGADRLCAQWAERNNVPCEKFAPDWKFGKIAGPIRNQQMIDVGKPDCAVAFPGGRGTADMVGRILAASIPLWQVKPASSSVSHSD